MLRSAQDIAAGAKRAGRVSKRLALEGLRAEIERMVPLVRRVMKPTRSRNFRGDTRNECQIVCVFEPSTEIIRKADRVRQDGEPSSSPLLRGLLR
jgi:IS5 family transposase